MKTLEQLNKAIERRNKSFNKKTKAEKRVIIAKDVLVRIALEQLKPQTNKITDIRERLCWVNTPLKDAMSSIKECEVCAKGGLLLSYVGIVNKFDLNDLEGGFKIKV